MSHNFGVLLVDDDPNVQSMFQMVMEHYDLTLDIASDEASTLAFLEQYQHNLIVLDIFLAGTDGYQILQTIRKVQGDNHTPAIAITAYYTSDTMDDVLRAGFDGYMLKPIDRTI
jgi:CheY-like chemotaxis protein